MDSLITVMNKLQDVFSTVGTTKKLNLPQIIVVGSQSSGKSSVLESLVGASFLPRGVGIVTRAPLILHLNRPTDIESDDTEPKKLKPWATFLHKPNQIFTDFNKVRKEIENITEVLAGDKKNITDKPIVLNVYSNHLYNLSFIDLPGLTKVPVDGQPADIEEKIRKLILHFIENPNSIILAIVTANTDPATSESLHIAKSVDPDGNRTIAVVTKIDIMDAGTNATELLSGNVIPIKLGIIGVVNRSQKDIIENKSLRQCLEAEKKFFRENYSTIAKSHGTLVLGKKLQYLLIQKIKETYPSLKKELYDMNIKCNTQMKHLREFTDNYDRSLLDLLTQTSCSYTASLDGHTKNLVCLEDLNGGAVIANYFKTVFNKEVDEIDPLCELAREQIINVIRNASGTSMGIFMPAQAFDHLVRNQLRLMEGPALACVSFVHEKLISILYNMDEDISVELKKYPELGKRILEVLQDLVDRYKQKTIESVSKLIRYQEAFMNTDHPDFIEAVVKSDEYHLLFSQAFEVKPQQGFITLADNNQPVCVEDLGKNGYSKPQTNQMVYKLRQTVEKISTVDFSGFAETDELIMESRAGLLTLFIKCYLKVIKKIIQDTVPKTIMYEMVNNVKKNLQKELISKVYKSKDVKNAELLLESPEIEEERIEAHKRYDASSKALALMREIEQICNVTD